MQKEKLLISACLLGVPCRYDGQSKPYPGIVEMLSERYELIPVCPEIYGGLSTPRTPSERVGSRVMMRDGRDVTENYRKGAEATLALAVTLGARIALLKAKSPSCGKGKIYDGSFCANLVSGNGVTADLLITNGITVYTEDEIKQLLK